MSISNPMHHRRGAVKNVLSPASQKVVDAFDEAAQNWGWTRDQGTGVHVDNDEAAHIKAKGDLNLHIVKMERKILRLQKQLKEHKRELSGSFRDASLD